MSGLSGADLEYQAMLARAGINPADAKGKDGPLLEQMVKQKEIDNTPVLYNKEGNIVEESIEVIRKKFVARVSDLKGVLKQEIASVCLHDENPTNVIKEVLRRGYTFVHLSEVEAAMRGEVVLPPRPFLLTFDDNRSQLYSLIHPIVVSYGIKANAFLTSDFASGLPVAANLQTFAPGTTWAQLQEMNETGLWDWGNHTKTHQNLDTLSGASLTSEIVDCNNAIALNLGRSVKSLAYPQGKHKPDTLVALRSAGIEIAFDFSSNSGSEFPAQLSEHPYSLNRPGPVTPLEDATTDVIYHWANDATGERNAANVLGFWTLPAGASISESGHSLTLNGSPTFTARELITTDYFRVRPYSGIIHRSTIRSWTHTVGMVGVYLRQYNSAKVLINDVTIGEWTGYIDGFALKADISLDPNCRYVRPLIKCDAAYDGSFLMKYGLFEVS